MKKLKEEEKKKTKSFDKTKKKDSKNKTLIKDNLKEETNYIPDDFSISPDKKNIGNNDSKNQINVLYSIFRWLVLGFEFECYCVFLVFKYLTIGTLFPVIFIYAKLKERSLRIQYERKQMEIKVLNEYKEKNRIKQLEAAKNKQNEDQKNQSPLFTKQNSDLFNDEAYRRSPNKQSVDENKLNSFIKPLEQTKSDYMIKNGKVDGLNPDNDYNGARAPEKSLKEKIHEWYHNLPVIRNIDLQKKTNDQVIVMRFDSSDAEKTAFKEVYEYRAKSPEGKFVIDYFEAYSKVEVYSYLLNEGYKVFSIRTSKAIQLFHGNLGGSSTKFKSKDLIFFLTQLSTYLKAGIPLIDALKILSRQYKKNKKYQKVFRKMVYDLTMGDTFSVVLENQGNTFPRLLINMVKTAEMTGELPDTLDKMAAYFTETHKTKQQMVTALTYPCILLGLALIVFTFIMLYVVPKFVSIYNAMENVQLPGITRAILNLSNFLKANIIWLILGIIMTIVIIRYLYKNIKSFRTVFQTFFMKLPVFGNIIIFNEVTLFAQTLGTLLSHNVFITDSMDILNRITNNEIYKLIILDTIENIAKGDKISAAFNHWAFPIPAYEMIVTGEKTGQLPEMMERVGMYYQELHRNEVARIKTFLEPVLIILLTIIVGIIVLAIVIPMFNMYSAIEGF